MKTNYLGARVELPHELLARNVAIATTTLYNPNSKNDLLRAEIAKRTIRGAVNLGYDVAIIDSGSSDELLKDFESYGAKLGVYPNVSMGQSRRLAINLADSFEKRITAWTEPEKEHYIPELWKTALPILEDKADMTVPDRRPLNTYPDFQRKSEDLGNLFFKDLTKQDLDIWCGPRTWRRDLSRYYTDYNGEYGDRWDSIFIPVIDAILAGERVLGVKVDYKHPNEQTAFEDGNIDLHMKRIIQLETLTKAMKTHWEKQKQ